MYCTSPAESFGRHFLSLYIYSMLEQYSSGISVLGYLLSNKIKKNKNDKRAETNEKTKKILSYKYLKVNNLYKYKV